MKKDIEKKISRDDREVIFSKAQERVFKIIYLFPHPVQDLKSASIFGWYSTGILDTAKIMTQACAMPADVREAHSDLEDVLLHRLNGGIWPHLLPVEIDYLLESINYIDSPFIVCITTDKDVAIRTDDVLQKIGRPALHVSSIEGVNRKEFHQFNVDGIYKYVKEVIDFLSKNPHSKDFSSMLRKIFLEKSRRKIKQHKLPKGGHNVTTPNEVALQAFGFNLIKTKLISNNIQPVHYLSPHRYIERICQSADAVDIERRKLLEKYPINILDNRLIIAVASSYARLYSTWQSMIQKAPDDQRKDYKKAMSMALHTESYFFNLSLKKNGELDFSPIARFIASEQSRDMRAFTAALSMLSSATLCPVIRLEPKLNRIRVDAAELARSVRASSSNHYPGKQIRMIRVLGQKMRSLVDAKFLEKIDKKELRGIEGIKLITDMPLELMPSNGIPLGLRFDTSRISPIPGNMFWQTCSMPPVRIPRESFYEVLVIRSFSKNDPIRNHLESALKTINFENVKYRFFDVETKEQFLEAVKSYDGAVMIFDGHGQYDAGLGIGCLVIGGKRLDTWSIKKLCKLPAVVMFSACDTQPIDGSHGSVATSAFALGARAVLGTMLPVNSIHSSTMMARMLLRIDQFLPIAASSSLVLNWRHIVSGMLRMSYATEALIILNKRAKFNLEEHAFRRVQMVANTEINLWSANWYEDWVSAIARETDRPNVEICKLLEQHVGLTDSMKYVHLGVPERVFIS